MRHRGWRGVRPLDVRFGATVPRASSRGVKTRTPLLGCRGRDLAALARFARFPRLAWFPLLARFTRFAGRFRRTCFTHRCGRAVVDRYRVRHHFDDVGDVGSVLRMDA
jgi:hypothetical protein